MQQKSVLTARRGRLEVSQLTEKKLLVSSNPSRAGEAKAQIQLVLSSETQDHKADSSPPTVSKVLCVPALAPDTASSAAPSASSRLSGSFHKSLHLILHFAAKITNH